MNRVINFIILPIFLGILSGSIVCLIGLLLLSDSPTIQKNNAIAYEQMAHNTAERAGYEWIGCESIQVPNTFTILTTCLVKIDGNIVDIDHVRAE